jgi:hypothetical protein
MMKEKSKENVEDLGTQSLSSGCDEALKDFK